jgi:hypothetical protein
MKKEVKSKEVKCIICFKKLTREHYDEKPTDTITPVYDGLVCRSYGNYGSRLYDPMVGKEFLEFYICDKCMEKKSKMVSWIKYKKESVAEDYKTFDCRLKEEKKTDVWMKRKLGIGPKGLGRGIKKKEIHIKDI